MAEICKLCSGQTKSVYYGHIRDGRVGNMTDTKYHVLACDQCQVGFLDPIPDLSYDSAEYRQKYNDSEQVETYFQLHDTTQLQHMKMLQQVNFRHQIVADFGCGGGSFLDYVTGLASTTIGVEPFIGYHQSLIERGHKVYAYGHELVSDEKRLPIDIAVSIHVIEHVSNPIEYLKEIHQSLGDGGMLYLVTPNYNDILLKLIPDDYATFFYRTAHFWYFEANSLVWSAQQAGFNNIEIRYQQNYDLSNAFCWVRDARPTGLKRLDLFSHMIDNAWQGFLEESGQSDSIWMILKK